MEQMEILSGGMTTALQQMAGIVILMSVGAGILLMAAWAVASLMKDAGEA